MFQRSIFRQAKAVRSVISSSSPASQALRQTTQSRVPAIRAFAPQTIRSYSTEKEASEAQNGEAENPIQKELDEKNKEVIELKDKYLRSVADFRNLQERTKRDMDGARNFAIQRFAKDLLDSIDNFDRALLAVPADKLSAAKTDENKDFLELVSGLKMTQNILLNTLQKHGLERFDPAEKVDGKAQKFDPNLHEATFMAKADGLEDGDVMFVQSKGFTLNGRVLRAAKVGVVKNT